jgi:hypothetical protein
MSWERSINMIQTTTRARTKKTTTKHDSKAASTTRKTNWI